MVRAIIHLFCCNKNNWDEQTENYMGFNITCADKVFILGIVLEKGNIWHCYHNTRSILVAWALCWFSLLSKETFSPQESCVSLSQQRVPDPLFADCFDKVFDMRLCEVLIIVLDEFRVDSWHGHEHINHWRLGAQQHLPHLRERERERDEHKIGLKRAEGKYR